MRCYRQALEHERRPECYPASEQCAPQVEHRDHEDDACERTGNLGTDLHALGTGAAHEMPHRLGNCEQEERITRMLLAVANHFEPGLLLELNRVTNEADAITRGDFGMADQPDADAGGEGDEHEKPFEIVEDVLAGLPILRHRLEALLFHELSLLLQLVSRRASGKRATARRCGAGC